MLSVTRLGLGCGLVESGYTMVNTLEKVKERREGTFQSGRVGGGMVWCITG